MGTSHMVRLPSAADGKEGLVPGGTELRSQRYFGV